MAPQYIGAAGARMQDTYGGHCIGAVGARMQDTYGAAVYRGCWGVYAGYLWRRNI
jgi:hypothetical protein